MDFGKSRVQYKEFIWQYYRFDRFDTYFYEGGKDLAAFVSEVAPEHIQDIENKLDFVFDEHIEFIVYNTQSDFRQSNLGMAGLDAQQEVGGTAQIAGTKVFVFYEGDRADLIIRLREGIARLMIQAMLYGGDWKDVVKSSALLNLPDWHTEGLVAYLSRPWSPDLRARVKDGILSGRYERFNRLDKDESVHAGYSIWKYIAEVYGESVIPNILYMTRLSRSVESGFVFVVGVPLDDLMDQYMVYYRNRFREMPGARPMSELFELRMRMKEDRSYEQFHLSPDGSKAAIVSNELGQYRIFLMDLQEYRQVEAERRKVYRQKQAAHMKSERAKAAKDPDYRIRPYRAYKASYIPKKKLLKAEHKIDRIADKSYPVLKWSPQGDELAFVAESKGKLWLNIHSLVDGKTYLRELFELDKVLSFDYAPDGKRMVFSGVRHGRTDIYLYYLIGNRQEKLTDDHYNDLEPAFVKSGKAVIFASDRDNDTLTVVGSPFRQDWTKDIFVMDLSDRRVLERITSSPDQDERSPQPYLDDSYTFLREDGRVYDRYEARYDSVIARVDTAIHYRYFTDLEKLSAFAYAPQEYHVNGQKEQYALLGYLDGRYRLYVGDVVDEDGPEDLGGIQDPEEQTNPESSVPRTAMQILGLEYSDPDHIDIDEYRFEHEEDQSTAEEGPVVIEDIEEIIALQNEARASISGPLPKPRNYKVNFATDKVLVQLKNAFTNGFYQSAGLGPQNLSPGMSPDMQWGFSDLFEDYKLLAGLNIQGGLNNMTYSLRFDDLSKRLDKAYIFTRQSLLLEDPAIPIRLRDQAYMFRYRLSYPFSEVFTLRSDLLVNYQRLIPLALSDLGLNLPTQHTYHGGVKSELVFDNTLFKGLNLFNGTRAKAWVEYYREYVPEDNSFPDMAVFGLDARHYQKVHRDIILAMRLAGSSSFGKQKVVHYLGSVDNWILPRPQFDDSNGVDASQNYVYQAMVTPMRGFWRNARNGSSAAVASSEIRFPVFKYFIERPIQSDFLNNFQIVGFGDVGAAWTGRDPYSDDNSFNNIVDDSDPNITVILENQEEPILMGYGFGLRSRLLGYFVRFDWSYGIVDGRRLPNQFYLSLNLDF